MEYRKQKFRLVGHASHGSQATSRPDWYLKEQKLSLGKPPRRREDEIVKRFKPVWRRKARSRMKWKCMVASDVKTSDELMITRGYFFSASLRICPYKCVYMCKIVLVVSLSHFLFFFFWLFLSLFIASPSFYRTDIHTFANSLGPVTALT